MSSSSEFNLNNFLTQHPGQANFDQKIDQLNDSEQEIVHAALKQLDAHVDKLLEGTETLDSREIKELSQPQRTYVQNKMMRKEWFTGVEQAVQGEMEGLTDLAEQCLENRGELNRILHATPREDEALLTIISSVKQFDESLAKELSLLPGKEFGKEHEDLIEQAVKDWEQLSKVALDEKKSLEKLQGALLKLTGSEGRTADIETMLKEYPQVLLRALGSFHALEKNSKLSSLNLHPLKNLSEALEKDPMGFSVLLNSVKHSLSQRVEAPKEKLTDIRYGTYPKWIRNIFQPKWIAQQEDPALQFTEQFQEHFADLEKLMPSRAPPFTTTELEQISSLLVPTLGRLVNLMVIVEKAQQGTVDQETVQNLGQELSELREEFDTKFKELPENLQSEQALVDLKDSIDEMIGGIKDSSDLVDMCEKHVRRWVAILGTAGITAGVLGAIGLSAVLIIAGVILMTNPVTAPLGFILLELGLLGLAFSLSIGLEGGIAVPFFFWKSYREVPDPTVDLP